MPPGVRFNPFPGLRPFEPDEDHLFFGREKEIDDLLRRYGIEPSGAVLIRPDGFVGFRSISSADDEQKALSSAVRQILDLS